METNNKAMNNETMNNETMNNEATNSRKTANGIDAREWAALRQKYDLMALEMSESTFKEQAAIEERHHKQIDAVEEKHAAFMAEYRKARREIDARYREDLRDLRMRQHRMKGNIERERQAAYESFKQHQDDNLAENKEQTSF